MDRGAALGPDADGRKQRRHDDEERKQRQDRHIGQISGMDEAILPYPGHHPLHDDEDMAAGADMVFDALLQPGRFAQRLPPPRFG